VSRAGRNAASAGIGLFLTADLQLTKLSTPGIRFIADFNDPVCKGLASQKPP